MSFLRFAQSFVLTSGLDQIIIAESRGLWGRRFLAFGLGVFCGGGLIGAPFFYFLPGDRIDPGTKSERRYLLLTWAGFVGVGTLIGLFCMWVEIGCEAAQHAVLDVRADMGFFLTRGQIDDVYPDSGWFSVQLTHMAREAQVCCRCELVCCM